MLLINSEAVYHVELFPPSSVLALPTLLSFGPAPPQVALLTAPSRPEPPSFLTAPHTATLAAEMSPATARWEKEKHSIYLLLHSYKRNKHRMSQRYLNEQLIHVTMDFLSFLAFSFPLCYSYDKPTYTSGLKTDCKQLEQRLSHLVCTRPTTMEPLSCLQTFSTAIIQILLIMIVNVE